MTRLVPNPDLARVGIGQSYGALPPPAPFQPKRADVVSPLNQAFAEFKTITAFADVIPTGAALPTAATGESFWYCLKSIRVGEDEDPFLLAGARFELRPTDSTPNGTGPHGVSIVNSVAWGDTTGLSAAVVIGRGLSWLKENQWTVAPANLPFIEQNTAGNRPVKKSPEYITWTPFPPGKFSDTTPNYVYVPDSYAPNGIRFEENGGTLDFAIVLRAGQVTGNTSKFVCGFIKAQARIALRAAQTPWGQL